MKTKLIALLALAAFATGCGGGGQPVIPSQQAAPAGSMIFSFAPPVGTESVIVALTAHNGVALTPPVLAVALLTSFSCAGAGVGGTPIVCTVANTTPVNEPVGTDTITVATYSQLTPAYGRDIPLSIRSASYSVASGYNPAVAITLTGVVDSLAFAPASGPAVIGAASANAVTLQVLDALGNIIVGPGYDTLAGAADTITLSCAPGLTAGFALGGPATASITAPWQNGLAQIAYSGATGTAGGSLTCTATDTQAKSATYTVNLLPAGTVIVSSSK